MPFRPYKLSEQQTCTPRAPISTLFVQSPPRKPLISTKKFNRVYGNSDPAYYLTKMRQFSLRKLNYGNVRFVAVIFLVKFPQESA